MSNWIHFGEVPFIVLFLFFFFFSLYSLLDKERKAFWRSNIFFLLLPLINLGFFLLPPPLKMTLFRSVFYLFAFVVLILMVIPLIRKKIQIVGEQKRIDERDIIFARFDLEEGTTRFDEYYEQRPQYRDIDQDIRRFPDLFSPLHIQKDPFLFNLANAEFDFLEQQLDLVNGKHLPVTGHFSPLIYTRMIRNMLNYLGVEVWGVCLLDQAYVYSHVGRGPESYGQEINLSHKYGIVFALEMELDMIAAAPRAPVIVETGKKYIQAAQISIILADFIRRMGYPARAHIAGSNYQAILPPLGWLSGLGELGRLGILITDKYGPRARLGLVTTDLPLIPNIPKTLGIQNFCYKCKKCALNCPAQAIPYGKKTEENGVMKWVLNREQCYKWWRVAGTDCAVCIYVCPYSKSNNAFHKSIRKMINYSYIAQYLSVWGDDFFYGRYLRGVKRVLMEKKNSLFSFSLFKK